MPEDTFLLTGRDQDHVQGSCKIQGVLTRELLHGNLFYSFVISIIVKICMLTTSGREEDVTKGKKNPQTKPQRDNI